jgi:hypothetical protein
VVCTVQVASKIAAESQIDFGTVIAGATANQTLHVTDSATPPADDLDYTLGAPAGFTRPAGRSRRSPATQTSHHRHEHRQRRTKSGTLAGPSDAPDSLTKNVLLAGRWWAHASPSLDSTVSCRTPRSTSATSRPAASATARSRSTTAATTRLQARLSVNTATSPAATVASRSWAASRRAGLGPGRRYTSTSTTRRHQGLDVRGDLTFATSDEPLPGAITLSALAVHLVARPKRATWMVPGAGTTALRFYAPRPNPLARETRFAFDLPREAPVSSRCST